MSTGLIIVSSFVFLVYLVGNVTEWYAHKEPHEHYTYPEEDLRLACAPDFLQAHNALKEYPKKQKEREWVSQVEHAKEQRAKYERELEDARIRRWLEGNPVTKENPL